MSCSQTTTADLTCNADVSCKRIPKANLRYLMDGCGESAEALRNGCFQSKTGSSEPRPHCKGVVGQKRCRQGVHGSNCVSFADHPHCFKSFLVGIAQRRLNPKGFDAPRHPVHRCTIKQIVHGIPS